MDAYIISTGKIPGGEWLYFDSANNLCAKKNYCDHRAVISMERFHDIPENVVDWKFPDTIYTVIH